jgi:putative phage-type endonuclease
VNGPIVPTGVPIPRIEVGDPEWLQIMSASKIAAVLGLSPWESRFSLYHRMTGAVPNDPGNDNTRRGHYLEPSVAAWFADQLPDHLIEDTGTWLHCERAWQAATPDRLVTDPDGNTELLEIKTSSVADGWGDVGTDEIPVYYRAQVIWQLDTLGLRRCHVAVLLPFLDFRAYVVEYDEAEAQLMRDAAQEFLDDIQQGNRPPIDDTTATYQVVRELHPDIDGEEVAIPDALADGYQLACDQRDYWSREKQRFTSQITDAMGSARYATNAGERVAMRVPGRGTNPPFLRPCKPGTSNTNRSAA